MRAEGVIADRKSRAIPSIAAIASAGFIFFAKTGAARTRPRAERADIVSAEECSVDASSLTMRRLSASEISSIVDKNLAADKHG